jgi:hypothetical protein
MQFWPHRDEKIANIRHGDGGVWDQFHSASAKSEPDAQGSPSIR